MQPTVTFSRPTLPGYIPDVHTRKVGPKPKAKIAPKALPSMKTQPVLALDHLAKLNRLQVKAQAKPRFGGGLGNFPYDKVDIQLGNHPTDSPYFNQLDDWRKKIWTEATKPRPGFPKGWLQPLDTLFQMANQTDLMEAAARGGFPTRYRHWVWGQDFNDQYQRQRFGLGRLYEMVINTEPSYAFLYDRNPVYAQKVVMAHVLGHTDFFKNNLMFSESNKNMVRVMADNKARVEQYYADPRLSRKTADGVHPVEKFLNQFNAIEWLVDMSALSPPPLDAQQDSAAHQDEDDATKHTGKAGLKAHLLGAAPWMQDFLYEHKDWEKHRDHLLNEDDALQEKALKRPTRDILGFLVEHGKGLKPWQQDILKGLREESYYFVPQVRTKLMNEGWATFWHHKLMSESPNLINEAETLDISKMMAGVETPAQNGINPYQVGYAIFKNIYTRAGYGLEDFDTTFQPNKVIRYEDLKDRIENRAFNEEAGLKKVYEARKWLNDVEFIRKYFTPEVAEELGMHITNEREEWDRELGQRVRVKYVESDDFQKIKGMILEQYQNVFPTISLVDVDHNGKGELRLQHDNPVQDLDLPDTRETMATLSQFWGKPVHLDTVFEAEVGAEAPRVQPYWGMYDQPGQAVHERRPVRLSYQDGKINIFLLDKNGKPEKNITDKYF